MCQGTISPLCNGPLNHCIQFTKTTKAREEEREQSALSPLLRTMKFKKVWLHIYFPWQIGSVLWSALLHGIKIWYFQWFSVAILAAGICACEINLTNSKTSQSHFTVTNLAESCVTLLFRCPKGSQGCLEKRNHPLSSNLVVWCTKIGPKTKKVWRTSESDVFWLFYSSNLGSFNEFDDVNLPFRIKSVWQNITGAKS